ncbi:MAG: hypothetical protein IPN34_11090 [Planctomycetes bacterium]|nr:hypothetical protein [Planctomycetota bacterium]
MNFQIISFVVALLMLVDAIRRRPHWAWYAVILLVPFGGWIYLALVALPAWNGQPHLGGGVGPRARSATPAKSDDLAGLRERLARLRSTENLVELAEALLVRREMHEAVALADEAQARDASDRRARFVLGAAHLALGDFTASERALAPLVAAEPGYRDHEARLLLSEALWHLDRREEALSSLRDLAQRSRALPHRMALSKLLERAGWRREARNELESALAEHTQAPEHVKKRLRGEAKLAEQRLAELRREA